MYEVFVKSEYGAEWRRVPTTYISKDAAFEEVADALSRKRGNWDAIVCDLATGRRVLMDEVPF